MTSFGGVSWGGRRSGLHPPKSRRSSLKKGGRSRGSMCPISAGFRLGSGHAGGRAGVKVERPAGRTTLRPVLPPAILPGAGNRYVVVGAAPGAVSLAGRPPAAVIPSGFPRWLAAGAWGVPRAGSGINQRRGRAARGRGPDLRAITRCPCPGLLTRRLSRRCAWPVIWPARRAWRRRRR